MNDFFIALDLLVVLGGSLIRFVSTLQEDCEVLWMDPCGGGRPEDLVLQSLLVPPVPIRPSVAMDVGGGSNEDDLGTDGGARALSSMLLSQIDRFQGNVEGFAVLRAE